MRRRGGRQAGADSDRAARPPATGRPRVVSGGREGRCGHFKGHGLERGGVFLLDQHLDEKHQREWQNDPQTDDAHDD
jgi:hypothetical protein